jgi:hypothetical protein
VISDGDEIYVDVMTARQQTKIEETIYDRSGGIAGGY